MNTLIGEEGSFAVGAAELLEGVLKNFVGN